MAPQHTLTTAPGHTGWNTDTLTISAGHPHSYRWTNRQPTLARTYGNTNRGQAAVYAGTIETNPETTTPAQWDSVRYLAAEANAWLDREFWSDPAKATGDHTADTHDDLTAMLRDIRRYWQTHWQPLPKVALTCYGKPESATTTQSKLVDNRMGGYRAPESYPPSYYPEWLDVRLFGFDWME